MRTKRSKQSGWAAVAGAQALALACVGGVTSARMGAQQVSAPLGAPPASAPGLYERARLLVEGGRGADGRRLVDSLVAASPAASPALAEALWWRAALAADARDSERDLRRLAAEVPESPRVGPATVRLAQLALLRDQPEEAAVLLAPLAEAATSERPADPARALAAYWLARARVERRDAAGACRALVGADSADAELTAQVAALRGRLPGCLAPAAVLAAAPHVAASAPRTASPGAGAAPTRATRPPALNATGTARPASAAPGAPPAAAPAAAGTTPAAPGAAPNAAPSAVPNAVNAVPNTAPNAAPAGRAAPAFAVQVAAYDAPGGAAALAARLRAAGLDAASEGQGPAGDAAPFRVKVGRYPTRAAAAAALRDLRRRGLAGFVTDAPRTAGTPGGAP